jgi:hypothetical protein
MTCPKFPKIDTLFTRDDKHVITNIIRRPEFLVPFKWLATEKIDGTNIRISLEQEDAPEIGRMEIKWVMRINGRNDNSQIPSNLLRHLQETFTLEGLKSLWRCKGSCLLCAGTGQLPIINPDDLETDGGTLSCPNVEPYHITLYGEGYGGGIQKGGAEYTSKTKGGAVSFRLFDVLVGETWLDRKSVEDVTSKLSIKAVPLLGTEFSIDELVQLVRRGFGSTVAYEEGTLGHSAEGIMAFTSPPLFNSRGQRLIFKLKTRDFEGAPSYTRTDGSVPVTPTE